MEEYNKDTVKVGRVTGLDPARDFQGTRGLHQQNDGDFVDIIHTTKVKNNGSAVDTLNYATHVGGRGHVDFFPNGGGAPQPQCTLIERLEENKKSGCSHDMAFKYFAASLLDKSGREFTSYKCDSVALLDKCMEDFSNGNTNSLVGHQYDGNQVNKLPWKGVYFLIYTKDL